MKFFRGHIDIDNSKLIDKCYFLWEKHKSPTEEYYFERGVYRPLTHGYAPVKITDKNLLIELSPIYWEESADIMSTLHAYMKKLHSRYRINENWFNIMPKDSYVGPHNHDGADRYVFVYYVKIDSDHPSIEFKHQDDWHPIKCNVGDWILFDKDMYHRVGSNNVTENRITITINL